MAKSQFKIVTKWKRSFYENKLLFFCQKSKNWFPIFKFKRNYQSQLFCFTTNTIRFSVPDRDLVCLFYALPPQELKLFCDENPSDFPPKVFSPSANSSVNVFLPQIFPRDWNFFYGGITLRWHSAPLSFFLYAVPQSFVRTSRSPSFPACSCSTPAAATRRFR